MFIRFLMMDEQDIIYVESKYSLCDEQSENV